MTDSTHDGSADEPVRLSKADRQPTPPATPGSTGADAPALGTPGAPPVRPVTVTLALAALAVAVVGLIVRTIALRGYTAQLQALLVHNNATAKTPKKNYDLTSAVGRAAVDKDLHTLRNSAVLTTVLFVIALLIVGYMLLRPRYARLARWAAVAIVVLSEAPFYLFSVSGYPGFVNGAGYVFGGGTLLALVALFVRPTSVYVRQCQEWAFPERVNAPKPSLRDAFAPRRPRPAPSSTAGRTTAGRTTAGRTAAGGPDRTTAPARASRPVQRGKVRTEDAAADVTPAAAPARPRPQTTSKSRRSDG